MENIHDLLLTLRARESEAEVFGDTYVRSEIISHKLMSYSEENEETI